MRNDNGTYTYSPSDLITYLESPVVSWMDRLYAEDPSAISPDEQSGMVAMICAEGDLHEARYLEVLRSEGREVRDLAKGSLAATIEAMRAGVEVIYQPRLELMPFAGFADFLIRVPGRSTLGDYHYEIWDTKLAREPKPYYLVQLCCYAEMLGELQGRRPERICVVLGTQEQRYFRTEDFFYFYLELKVAFLSAQATFSRDSRPEVFSKEDFGRWGSEAEEWLESTDHLTRVANITSSQIVKLSRAGICTMAALAIGPRQAPAGLVPRTYERLQLQAQLQIRSTGKDQPEFILLPSDGGQRRGLAILPPSDVGDVFFDLEGYPLYGDNGLEYLWGAAYDENGEIAYRDWWAHDYEQESVAFGAFIKWSHARWQQHPGMHIYHYAAYEESAIYRLLKRSPGVCEDEADDLLRNEVFVDLYAVVRHSLLIGEPRYSLKNVEHIYRGRREGEVTDAGDSIVAYRNWMDSGEPEAPDGSPLLAAIRDYNKDDCVSTAQLVGWLRTLQEEHVRPYIPPTVLAEPETKELPENAVLAAEILSEAVDQAVRGEGSPEENKRIHDLVGHLLQFHRREDKPVWWSLFDRATNMTFEQLEADLNSLAGCRRAAVPVRRSSTRSNARLLYQYSFDPDQDTKIDAGATCRLREDVGYEVKIEEFDPEAGVLTLSTKGTSPEPPAETTLLEFKLVSAKPIVASLVKTSREWLHNGRTLAPHVRDFLYRRFPNLENHVAGAIVGEDADLVACTVAAVQRMRNTTLCIQGPPGTGKTYTAAQSILALLKDGKRVGISANSHKAILNVVEEVCRIATEQKLALSAAHICSDQSRGDDFKSPVPVIDSVKSLKSIPQMLSGTAWAFSAPELESRFDYLFIDEAGQVSVANLIGMARSSRNLVLIGDQMQLDQPTKGAHPGESGQSCLEYLLQGNPTIPADFGIFLGISRRMHPEVCRFVSATVYEDRLHSASETQARILRWKGATTFAVKPAGILFVSVEHAGDKQCSDDEAQQVMHAVNELLSASVEVYDSNLSGWRHLAEKDILVIAPYNMQVRKLRSLMPRIRVGTVDKFQGQQAAVVIYSMAASSPQECPRGIEFLLSRNRTNVAISRAQTLAIVVASPLLSRPKCSTIEQMALANTFCRIMRDGQARFVSGIGD